MTGLKSVSQSHFRFVRISLFILSYYELLPGELLPSIRHLAKELQISVITTKRAYEELERDGFVESVAGKGSFVAGQSSELLREKRLKLIEEKLAEVVSESRVLEIRLPELMEMLTLLYGEE